MIIKLLLGVVIFWLLVSKASAQQNLFNMPSGDITPARKVFYQHQLNFYSFYDFESKSHLVYGLGKKWDIGLNLVDVPIRIVQDSSLIGFNDYQGRKPLYPLLMATAQKQIVINDRLAFNIGTQVGPNLTTNIRNKRIAHFTYATLKWKAIRNGFLIAGPYYTNRVFTGGEPHTFGWMFGYELPLTKRISLMGDLISGKHKKSSSTFGALYDFGKRVQLCAAALLPFPNTKLPAGLVLELNIYGWDFKSNH